MPKKLDTLPTAEKEKGVKKPKKVVQYGEWVGEIKKQLPDLRYSAIACACALIQLKMDSVQNPVALVLKDAPSSGKTVCLNLFSGFQEFVMYNDEFTENALVSGNEGQNDFIATMKDKCTIIPDLATLLHSSEDKVRTILGKLTRLLDGQGYSKASATASGGQKNYGIAKQEKHMFVMLMATTELSQRVHECMSGLGPRMMFMNVGSRRPDENVLFDFLEDKNSFVTREQKLRGLTTEFMRSMWQEEPELYGQETEEEARLAISRIAIAMAFMRSDVQVTQDRFNRQEIAHSIPQREHAWRLVTTLHNMAQAHAFLRKSKIIQLEDIHILFRLLFGSGPQPRPKIIELVIKNGGSITDTEVSDAVGLTRSQAKRELSVLGTLSFGTINKKDDDDGLSPTAFDFGNSHEGDYIDSAIHFTFTLSHELQWLHQSEWLDYYKKYEIFS